MSDNFLTNEERIMRIIRSYKPNSVWINFQYIANSLQIYGRIKFMVSNGKITNINLPWRILAAEKILVCFVSPMHDRSQLSRLSIIIRTVLYTYVINLKCQINWFQSLSRCWFHSDLFISQFLHTFFHNV